MSELRFGDPKTLARMAAVKKPIEGMGLSFGSYNDKCGTCAYFTTWSEGHIDNPVVRHGCALHERLTGKKIKTWGPEFRACGKWAAPGSLDE